MYDKWSTFDRIYRRLLLSKMFTRGWGNPATIKKQFDFLRVLADRSSCQRLVNKHYPVTIDKEEQKGEVRIVDGHFRSPFDRYLPDVMPKEVQTARFQLIVPNKWPTHRKPVCIHMAGTGDHFFWRRRTFIARPLLKEYGIGSLLLENPFYGYRKPKAQLRSSLQHVNDLFVMGGGLILEGLVMLHWCEQQGFGPLGLTGISMGGHMASLAATNWHKPLPLIPCLSWSSATPAFTEGVLSGSIPWPVLVTQYIGRQKEYEQEILQKLQRCPKTDAFRLGQEFAWNYPDSLDDLRGLKQTKDQPPANRSSALPQTQTQSATPTSVDSVMHPTHTSAPFKGSKQEELERCVMDKCEGHKGDPRESLRRTKEGQAEGTKRAAELWPMGKLDAQQAAQDALGDAIAHHRVEGGVSKTGEGRGQVGVVRNGEGSRLEGTSNAKVESHSQDQSADMSDRIPGDTTWRVHATPKAEGSPVAGSASEGSKRSAGVKKGDGKAGDTAKRKAVPGVGNYKDLKKEALEFMRGAMDVTTFVGNFSTPVDTSLVIVVTALKDGYIPRRGVPGLDDIWPGVEVRYVDCGHIHAFLFKQTEFRKAINDAFNKYVDKYDADDKKHIQSGGE